MSRPYSEKIRDEVIKRVYEHGEKVQHVSQDLNVSKSTIYSWLKENNEADKNSKGKFIIKRLEDQLKAVSEERKVLIKAASIFARELK
ncbi:MAG: hypothetical protein CMK65_11825 [Pseudoalteromonas sp.]|uniref:transposase n=1 Tax=Pseudoalteromonas TaxID=53246 RepID=UPI000C9288BB|nr:MULTISPECIES: transposase [Pseudoalteromonas]MAD04287.1 hypothetical protein [Pseudoalteromonas sp.]